MKTGILFDFDGVLAQTMEDFCRAWSAAFAEFGYKINPHDFFEMEGMHTSEVAAVFCKKGGISEKEIPNILAKKEAHYFSHHDFAFYPGVLELTEKLKTLGVPFAVVTAGEKARLEKTVPADFLSLFDSIVSKETCGRGKPFPDPYLRGASDLGLRPEECIVVENAPAGIKAAKAAGMYCIAIASTLPKNYLSEADEVIRNFADLASVKIISSLEVVSK